MLKDAPHVAVTDRTFGFLLSGVAALWGAWPLVHARPVRLWLLLVSAGLCLVAAACPRLLAGVKVAWFAVTTRVAAAVTFGLLTVIFFAVVTPVGLFFRLIGRDVMGRTFNSKAQSYWITRSTDPAAAQDMRHQF